MSRKCSRCHQEGHYAKTCKVVTQEQLREDVARLRSQPFSSNSNAEGGPQQQTTPQQTSVDSFGLPRLGLWIVSHKRKRIAGKIVSLKDDLVSYVDMYGAEHNYSKNILVENGYSVSDLEPKMLQWIH